MRGRIRGFFQPSETIYYIYGIVIYLQNVRDTWAGVCGSNDVQTTWTKEGVSTLLNEVGKQEDLYDERYQHA